MAIEASAHAPDTPQAASSRSLSRRSVHFSDTIRTISEPDSFDAVECNVSWTEAILNSDPRARSPLMRKEISKEVNDLITRGTFDLTTLSSTRDKNIVPSKFVLVIKHGVDGPRYKARFCIGGQRDRDKNKVVHSSSTLSQRSLRILL